MDEVQLTVGLVRLILAVTGTAVVTVVGALMWVNRTLDRRFGELGKKIDKDFNELETRIETVNIRAGLAFDQLHELRTHVAETYVTKQGFQEQFGRFREDILGRLDDVKDAMKALPANMAAILHAGRER